jgi:hypothetical protein
VNADGTINIPVTYLAALEEESDEEEGDLA